MKVISYKNTSPEADPVPLTWGEIKQREGVYKIDSYKGSPRFIVLKGSVTLVLFYLDDLLEPAYPGTWVSYTFYRTDEKVCFEIVP